MGGSHFPPMVISDDLSIFFHIGNKNIYLLERNEQMTINHIYYLIWALSSAISSIIIDRTEVKMSNKVHLLDPRPLMQRIRLLMGSRAQTLSALV